MAITFHIEPGDGVPVVVTNTDRLTASCVFLHDQLQGFADGEVVVLEAQEPCFGPAHIKFVLEHLRDGHSNALGDELDPASLAKVCNVLFAYKCDPGQFQHLWQELVQKSSPDCGHAVRPWQIKRERSHAKLAAQLVISALVLGIPEAFKRELEVVMWALSRKLNTTVSQLQDLEAMRLEEQQHIFQNLKEERYALFDQDDQRAKRLADEIKLRVRCSRLGEFTNSWDRNCELYPELKTCNPYKLIRRFEDAFKSRPEPATVTARRAQHQPQGPKAFPIDMAGLGEVLGQRINSIIRPNATTSAMIEKMLDVVQTKMRSRQRERAKELMDWRNDTVDIWRRKLGLPPLSTIPPLSELPPTTTGKEPETYDRHPFLAHNTLPPQQQTTNGHQHHSNGQADRWAMRPEDRDERSPERFSDSQAGPSGHRKPKIKRKTPASELSSVSTRRQPPTATPVEATGQRRHIMRPVGQLAPQLNGEPFQNGFTLSGAINGFDGLHVASNQRPAGEDSWNYNDEIWHGAGPSK